MKKLVVLFILILMLGACLLCTSLCFADEIQEDSQEEIVVEETIEATPDNDAWEWVKATWEKGRAWVIGTCAGVTIGGVVSYIGYLIVKALIKKFISKMVMGLDSKTIADKTVEKMLDKWSSVSLDVNIKPLMERQYLELSNRVYADLDKTIKAQDEKYLAMVKCFEELSHYYDGSVGVTDEQRKNLADAIEYAKSLNDTPTKSVATIEVAAEPIKETKSTKVAENY